MLFFDKPFLLLFREKEDIKECWRDDQICGVPTTSNLRADIIRPYASNVAITSHNSTIRFQSDDYLLFLNPLMSPIRRYVIAIVLFVILFGIRILRPRRVGVVTFLGKVSRVIREGFNVIIPVLESVRYTTLELINLSVKVDGITKDNVNTAVNINVIYRVKEDSQSIVDSIYKNSNVVQTIKSLIEEQLRAKIFEFEHEEIF